MFQFIIKTLENIINEKRIKLLLETEDFEPVVNIIPKKIKIIVFVVPGMFKFSGGYTSILRLGTNLSNNGYVVFYAATSIHQSLDTMRKNAAINLSYYKGEFIKFPESKKLNADIVIATFWRTTYLLKKFQAYKMYFIQDYEPYFYQYGETYLLAKKTYDLGFHMVSLGGWNKYKIEHDCGDKDKFDIIDFPFEPREYTFQKRYFEKLKDKNTIIIAAFIKKDDKRIPNIVISMMSNIKKQFAENGKEVVVKFFGMDKSIKISCGENLGVLKKVELLELYKKSDFGISASMTNVSLVPFEMIATGLPLIEFEDGTFPYFFPENSAILTKYNSKELFIKLNNAIENPEILYNMQNNAMNYIKDLSWNKTGQEFANIINNLE